MEYGIEESVIYSLIELFKKNKAINQVILFGSRAMGTYRPGSDIDLAIVGKNLSFNDYLTLVAEINQLDTLYTFDPIWYESIDNFQLKEHIKRVGIIIYEKNASAWPS